MRKLDERKVIFDQRHVVNEGFRLVKDCVRLELFFLNHRGKEVPLAPDSYRDGIHRETQSQFFVLLKTQPNDNELAKVTWF